MGRSLAVGGAKCVLQWISAVAGMTNVRVRGKSVCSAIDPPPIVPAATSENSKLKC